MHEFVRRPAHVSECHAANARQHVVRSATFCVNEYVLSYTKNADRQADGHESDAECQQELLHVCTHTSQEA
jgi:hypothetical protein